MSSRRVVIAGGTGFIGRALCERLLADGFDVVALAWHLEENVRIPGDRVEVVRWDGRNPEPWTRYADGAAAIINLVGDNIGSERWTEEKKHRILHSRVDAARAAVRAVEQVKSKPGVLIQGAAIGYYGRHGDEPIDEASPAGEGFYADVVRETEDSARKIEDLGVRFVAARSGVILGRRGGLLPRWIRPFRYFLGGPNGNGKYWISWIHLYDEVSAFRFLMDRDDLSGPFNLTSPDPLPMKELSHEIGRAMNRPSWFSTPGFWLRLRHGEMADAVLLSGARVLPERLLQAGFQFRYPSVDGALRDLLGPQK